MSANSQFEKLNFTYVILKVLGVKARLRSQTSTAVLAR
jgi:hypothetical protein